MQINTSQSSLNKFSGGDIPLPSNEKKVYVLSGIVLLASQSKISGNSSLGVQQAYDLGLADCPSPKALILDTQGKIPTDPNTPRYKLAGFGNVMAPRFLPWYLMPINIIRYLEAAVVGLGRGDVSPTLKKGVAFLAALRRILDGDESFYHENETYPGYDYSNLDLKCGCPDPLAKPVNLLEHDNIEEIIEILQKLLPDIQNGIKFHSINDVKSSDSYNNILKTLLEDASISTKVKVNSYLGALDGIGNMLLDGASTQEAQAGIDRVIEGIKVVGFLGSELSSDQIEEKREKLDLIKNEYQAVLNNIDNSPVLNFDDLDAESIKKTLNNIQLVGEKQCLGDLVLNDQCDCMCPEGKIRCPEDNTCIDCNNENGGLVVIKEGWTRNPNSNSFYYCDCGCVDETMTIVKVGVTSHCVKCPEGTTFQWIDCEGEDAGWRLSGVDEKGGSLQKCFRCVCCKVNQPPGIQYRIPCTEMDAFSNCPSNAARTGSDCECNCMEGYVKVLDPYDNGTDMFGRPRETGFRCVKPCPPRKVYIWDTDSCECPQLARDSRNGTFSYAADKGTVCFDQYTKVWDNDLCACICPDGAAYNVLADTCECSEGTVLLDGECVPEGSGSGGSGGDEGSGSGSGEGDPPVDPPNEGGDGGSGSGSGSGTDFDETYN